MRNVPPFPSGGTPRGGPDRSRRRSTTTARYGLARFDGEEARVTLVTIERPLQDMGADGSEIRGTAEFVSPRVDDGPPTLAEPELTGKQPFLRVGPRLGAVRLLTAPPAPAHNQTPMPSVATTSMPKHAKAFACGHCRARVGVSVCTWIVDAPP